MCEWKIHRWEIWCDKEQWQPVRVVKKRQTAILRRCSERQTDWNEFLIGWRDFPDPIHDTWEPLAHLSNSEHMIREFNQKWEQDHVTKTAETLEDQTSVVWDLYRLTYTGAFWTPPWLTWCVWSKQAPSLDHLERDQQRGHTHNAHTLHTHSLTNPYIYTFLCVSHTNTLEPEYCYTESLCVKLSFRGGFSRCSTVPYPV